MAAAPARKCPESAVLDTNVLISATLFDSSLAQKLLNALVGSGASLFTSEHILSEYERIVKRDFIKKRGLTVLENRLPYLLASLRRFLVLAKPKERVSICRDPTDNRILECAAASSSDYIVTFDPDLLDLKNYGLIKIVHPLEMLRILGKK